MIKKLVQFLENNNNNLKKDFNEIKTLIHKIHKQFINSNKNEIQSNDINLSSLKKIEEMKVHIISYFSFGVSINYK